MGISVTKLVVLLVYLFKVTPYTASASSTNSWSGVNCFFLHTLSADDQIEILENLALANVSTVRIFLSTVYNSFKGSSSVATSDLEQDLVGSYDDDILLKVDKLMVRAHDADIKIIISLHDRYSLGCWSSDAYVVKYNLPISPDCSTDVNDPIEFYTNESAIQDYDNRIQHILKHQSDFFNNISWSHLSDYIYAFEIENESQGYISNPNLDWLCGRATMMRSYIETLGGLSNILISTGGGIQFDDSLRLEYFDCEFVDLVSIHSYEDIVTFPNGIEEGLKLAAEYNKLIIFEEFGTYESKGDFISDVWGMTNFYQVPSMIWEVMKPNNFNDLEFYIEDTDAWEALGRRSGEALNRTSLSTGAWCMHNSDCESLCCSNVLSNQDTSPQYGRLVCIDLQLDPDDCNAPNESEYLEDGSFCAQSIQCDSTCCAISVSESAMVCSIFSDDSVNTSSCIYP